MEMKQGCSSRKADILEIQDFHLTTVKCSHSPHGDRAVHLFHRNVTFGANALGQTLGQLFVIHHKQQ